jgi:hypothetical protein
MCSLPLLAFALVSVGTAGVAQNAIASPAAYDLRPGNGAFAFSAPLRLQQIHGDLRNQSVPIRSIVLRRFTNANSIAMPARTIDVEIALTDSSFASATTVFANNHALPPVRVLPRTNVALPDISAPTGSPEPWSVGIPFLFPYPHTGQTDFLWEMTVHGSSSAASYTLDAWRTVPSAGGVGAFNGSGCRLSTTGREMVFQATADSVRASQQFELRWTGRDAPPNVPVQVLVGVQNPNLLVQGLCSPLYVSPLFTFGTASFGDGTFRLPTAGIAYHPALVGLAVHSQAVVADAGQPGLPLALSQGRQSTLVLMPPDPAPVATLVASAANASTGTLSDVRLIARFVY